MATTTPTTFSSQSTQTRAEDSQIVRVMRNNEITFVGKGLCPDKNVYAFLDKTRINRFIQKPNMITVTNGTMDVDFYQDEEIINNTTNAYARVITTSNNFIYINETFLNLNVKPYSSGSLTTSTFNDKDIVFQTATNTRSGVVTAIGTIERYTRHSASDGTIAIKPLNGAFRPTVNNILFLRTSASPVANVKELVTGVDGTLFPASSTIRSLENAAKTATVSSYNVYSGIITYQNGPGSTVVYVSSNTKTAGNPIGKQFRIPGGGAAGQARTITDCSANGLMLTLDGSSLYGIPLLASNSKFTISDPTLPGYPEIGQVDDYGVFTGIFHIPELADAYFPAGKRLFTLSDRLSPEDNGYKMRAFNFYSVEGRPPGSPEDPDYSKTPVDTVAPSNAIASNPSDSLINNKIFNPLSQTFFTPKTSTVISKGVANTLTGLQITGIDLFFAKKPTNTDTQLPVIVSIVTLVNDRPGTKVLGKSIVDAKNVKVSSVPDSTNTSTMTTFSFSPPVIVNPGVEYALTVTSSSPDYSLFSAEIGGTILGTTGRRVSQQPYVGDFYKAQNASTWTPLPNEDLMFRVRYGVTTVGTGGGGGSSSNTIYFVPDSIKSNTVVDAFIVNATDYTFKPTSVNYSYKSTKIDGTQDASFTSFKKNTRYDFGSDLATSTKTSNRRRKLIAGNRNSFNVKVDLTTTDGYVSPSIDLERMSITAFEFNINDAGISSSDIAFTNFGNHVNPADITVTFSAPDRADGVTANAYVAALSAVTGYTGNVSVIVIDNPGSGYYTTPTVTFSEAAATVNATAVIAGETGKNGGNCRARYVTRTITLADGFDAGDMRVYLDCNRPVGTDINVYYKVKSASDSDPFEEKNWKLMKKVTDIFSKDQEEVIELEYRPSLDVNLLSYVENGITYPIGGTFRQFALKIVLTAKDPSVTPSVRNFRAIATPSG